MKKKLLLLGLALVMVAGFLVGCGGSSGSGGSGDGGADTSGLPYDGVTLTLWGGNTELGTTPDSRLCGRRRPKRWA